MSASKYKETYPDDLIAHMSKGLSYESFGAIVKVGKTTLYDWENQHPLWKEAKEIAILSAMLYFEQRLSAKTSGSKINGIKVKDIDSVCLKFALATRFHETYGDKSKVEHSLDPVTINYGKKDGEVETH